MAKLELKVATPTYLIKLKKRRSLLELDTDILKACSKPAIITGIMYATGVNCPILKVRLTYLGQKGFVISYNRHSANKISRKPNLAYRKLYHTTILGTALVSLYCEVENFHATGSLKKSKEAVVSG